MTAAIALSAGLDVLYSGLCDALRADGCDPTLRREIAACVTLSDGVLSYEGGAPRPLGPRGAWRDVAIGVQRELDARQHTRRGRAVARRWDHHVSVVDTTWEACS